MLEIVPPQTCVIAINPVKEEPKVIIKENGEKDIDVKKILPLTIFFDHRALDLCDIIPFCKKAEEIFKNPGIIREW